MKYIYSHLGLGDHLICNGLIRSIIDEKEDYLILCKKHNSTSVSFMYRDLKNVDIFEIDSDDDVFKFEKVDVIRIGHEYLRGISNFDIQFYNQYKIPFENRWDKFYVDRDYNSESELYEKLNPSNEEYIFVHDDHSRGLFIKDEWFRDKKVIRPVKLSLTEKGITDNIFDYLTLIEKAKEIHCMDSSFRMMIDSMDILHDKMYFHTYCRGNNPLANSKLNWIKIN